MGAPSARPPPAVPAPQPPPAGLALARWVYVDERRTHEVHAGLRGGEFVVKESAFANDDPDEVIETATRAAEAWELQLLHFGLERRLSMLGRYWRYDLQQRGGWTLVRAGDAFESLDLRPVRLDLFHGRVAFYHFHEAGGKDVVLANIPQATPRGTRYLLATLRLAFPDAEGGDLALLHARLPAGPATSILARESLVLKDKGYAKLVAEDDFRRAHGADAPREAGRAYEALLARISEGRFGSAAAPRRAPIVDEFYTDYLRALTDPRLIALHARFLAPGEEEALVAGGDGAIRRFIAKKRDETPTADQHLLTVLQASLIAREGLRVGHAAKVDPEVAALVRRFAYYL